MDQNLSRHGEQGTAPFRTGRFYCIENEWWFAIRRGPDQGPYPTKAAAKLSLIEFLNDQFTFEKYLQQNKSPYTLSDAEPK
ncbi:MAG: hypothetical protein GC149_11200 [Gammaproteobacteria bacterium]|nr:hypothetical protein [Gammaproteobacteria bacterium]